MTEYKKRYFIMSKTLLTYKDDNFFINGSVTYPGTRAEGLLMNARFAQGIFDDKSDRRRYDRFGRTFDPERNTDDLIAALPEWYDWGLRAFTVGVQGGGPCFTVENRYIDNSPFSADGTQMDEAYLNRLIRLIRRADELGMAVIVSCFYEAQLHRLEDADAVRNALALLCKILKYNDFGNCIIEPCNEYNIALTHKIVGTDEGMAELLDLARRESGMLCGCSGAGGYFSPVTARASDVILIHGNGLSRNKLNQLITRARLCRRDVPVIVNEDSHDITNLEVCLNAHVSWGYYNNWTKQEPPVDWRVTEGEDRYFAERMAEAARIARPRCPSPYRLMGMERHMSVPLFEYGTMRRRVSSWMPEYSLSEGEMRFVRLAALYPEKVDYVEFYIDGALYQRVYDSPYTLNSMSNWSQAPVMNIPDTAEVYAVVHERDGNTVRVDAAR